MKKNTNGKQWWGRYFISLLVIITWLILVVLESLQLGKVHFLMWGAGLGALSYVININLLSLLNRKITISPNGERDEEEDPRSSV